MATIKEVHAHEILDSRANPTVQVDITLSDGSVGSAIVPSGASTGKKEALELRDNDPKRYLGKGVLEACAHVNTLIAKEIVGIYALEQSSLDTLLQQIDNTDNFSRLGANATLGVSMALARAASNSLHVPLYKYIGGINAGILPAPMLNIINGGSHADNNVDFQEYMIMPLGFDYFSEAMRASVEIYHHLKKILNEKGLSTGVGDEGGFAPNLKDNKEPLELIMQAIEKAGYKPGVDIFIALDIASSELYREGLYHLEGEGLKLDSEGLVNYYENLVNAYPIVSIEDGLDEDDWAGWEYLTNKLKNKIQLVGDDLFVTNSKILKKGIEEGIANAILIKPNQIGTISQTIDTVRLAQRNSYKTIISHRSGESEDSFIADLAVALNSGEIKTGAPARSERTAKYNRLLNIAHKDPGTCYVARTLFNKCKI
ncbi:phosphopyruvate hydratase [Helicobacter sp. 13S00401-1]|uniref:phosphopyruvate hydratase n=1 Tax=Helicobacter sp. 13S00401-1 TaxID=1905758 RepID=UPI000BA6E162|nr:phosphopyruvate hydratase [Helicobacter sp. 13S00401-1]PAF51863.1 phosphopyruvate hydratase [Helicobacter sp. 13S00401-1]